MQEIELVMPNLGVHDNLAKLGIMTPDVRR
jgi:hypothetical protein